MADSSETEQVLLWTVRAFGVLVGGVGVALAESVLVVAVPLLVLGVALVVRPRWTVDVLSGVLELLVGV